MKTRNLTQSRARNDPINRQIYGFSFRDFEDEDGIQDVISPYSLYQFMISNTPRTPKHVKKVNKLNDSRIVVSRQFDFTQKSKGKFSSRRTFKFIEYFGRNSWMRRFITINGPDEVSLGESMLLSRVRSIAIEGLRCIHITRRRETSIQFVHWIFIGRLQSIKRSTDRD